MNFQKHWTENAWGIPDESFTREQVVIMTETHLIEGYIYHPKSARMSDTLNSFENSQKPFVPLADATVSLISGKARRVFSSKFLLVKGSEIITIAPTNELISVESLSSTIDSAEVVQKLQDELTANE